MIQFPHMPVLQTKAPAAAEAPAYPWERFMDSVGETVGKAAGEAVAAAVAQQFTEQATQALGL